MTNNDTRFQTLVVPGDQIIYQQPGQTISHRTRSKTSKQPEQWTHVPLVVKLFKILALELQNQINTRKELEEDANFGDDDDDEVDDDDNNDGDDANDNNNNNDENKIDGDRGRANDEHRRDHVDSQATNQLKPNDDETTKYLERYDNLLDDVFDFEFFQEKDPDAFNDPLMQVDLLDYLKERLRLFSTHAWFVIFQQHLNSIERAALRKITVLP
jgi:importin-9